MNRLFSRLAPAATALILLAVAAAVVLASRWPLVHDAPLMHYVVFLMDHGFAPYRDIVEMNMPGSYMQEWAVVHTLGGGAHAWFAWDVFTGIAAILSGAWLTGPGRRWAGIAGSALAYLIHLSEGAWNLGQRDWVVAVLLVAAFAATAHVFRTGKPAWMALAICLCATAATIKPLIVIAPFLLLFAALWFHRRERRPTAALILWSFAGAIPPIVATALFLTRWGVWAAFVATLRGIISYYAGLQTLGLTDLLRKALPHSVALLIVGAFVLFVSSRSWRSWDSLLLLLGTSLGIVLFFLQRKGWTYHRYTTLAFLLIWIMVEIDRALRSHIASRRYVAALLLLVAALWLPIRSLRFERDTLYPTATLDHLQQDLATLGGSALSGNVQCLDMALGACINSLYRLQIVQSTGFIYDFYMFPHQGTPLTAQLQTRFFSVIAARPPKVIVLSSQNWPGDTFGYDQINRWPTFRDFLDTHYTIARTYSSDPAHPSIGYRLYLLRQ